MFRWLAVACNAFLTWSLECAFGSEYKEERVVDDLVNKILERRRHKDRRTLVDMHEAEFLEADLDRILGYELDIGPTLDERLHHIATLLYSQLSHNIDLGFELLHEAIHVFSQDLVLVGMSRYIDEAYLQDLHELIQELSQHEQFPA